MSRSCMGNLALMISVITIKSALGKKLNSIFNPITQENHKPKKTEFILLVSLYYFASFEISVINIVILLTSVLSLS